MKKRANLPALITGIAAFCLWAFLLLLIRSYACQLAYTLLPKSSLEYSCAGVPPDLPPGSISTEASVPVTNAELRVSFKHPQGWALIGSGILKGGIRPIQYATYGLKGQPDPPTFTISKQDIGGLCQDAQFEQDGWVRTATRSAQESGAEIIEELREMIRGLPAGGVRYVRKTHGEVGFRLVVSCGRQTTDFEWMSDVRYSSQLEQIYRAMLPTIRLIPAPP